MFNLMAVVINKQMNKVFYCFDPNFARNISIIAGNIEINIIAIIKSFKIFPVRTADRQKSSLHSKIKLPIWLHLSDCRS